MSSNQGHWRGERADPHNHFGFTYIINDLTSGKSYIGKRQYWAAKPKAKRCKSKVYDKQSPRWKASCWVEAQWRDYKGSSKGLTEWMMDNPDHEYQYILTGQYHTRGDLVYAETMEMWKHHVLEALLPSGERRYFNKAIGGVKFIPPMVVAESTRKKLSEAHKGKIFSESHKDKISKALKGKPKPEGFQDGNTKALGKSKPEGFGVGNTNAKGNSGKPKSEEHRRNISNSLKGREPSDYCKDRVSQVNRDKTIYRFVHKDGTRFVGIRLDFINKYSLRGDSVSQMIRGKIITHNYWRLDDKED